MSCYYLCSMLNLLKCSTFISLLLSVSLNVRNASRMLFYVSNVRIFHILFEYTQISLMVEANYPFVLVALFFCFNKNTFRIVDFSETYPLCCRFYQITTRMKIQIEWIEKEQQQRNCRKTPEFQWNEQAYLLRNFLMKRTNEKIWTKWIIHFDGNGMKRE